MLLSLHNFQLKEASGGSLNPLKVQPAIRADRLKANTVFVMVVSPVWWVTDWGSRKCAWFSASRQSLFLLSGCRYSDSLKNTFIQNILEPSWNRFYVRKRQIQNRNCCLMFFCAGPLYRLLVHLKNWYALCSSASAASLLHCLRWIKQTLRSVYFATRARYDFSVTPYLEIIFVII